MTTLNNNTNGANTNNNGGMDMNNLKQSTFGAKAKKNMAGRIEKVYNSFKGYNITEEMMLPKQVCFAEIDDAIKFFAKNYAIAGATGSITEGVYRVLSARTIEEISKAIKNFGTKGTENNTGKRYVDFGELIRSTKVVPKLGGGSMRLRTCSKFEVQEFFNNRVVNIDMNACNEEDIKAIKADMQVIGRVLQEIAIDIAKDKSLDAGVDLMTIFTYIPVLSRLIRKADDGLVDNITSISSMIEDAIAKDPVMNTGVEIDSIPDYSISVKQFDDVEFINDWASELQLKNAKLTETFFNTQFMPIVKQAGATQEDLEIQQLVLNHGECVGEMVKIMDLFNKYVRSLKSSTDTGSNTKAMKVFADKEVKAAFRDTLYAIGRAYGHTDAMTRKLAYGATMVNGVHRANISKAMAVLGEDDMLLMWSNEEGIVRESVSVELNEVFEELFDTDELNNIAVNFVDDIAYDINGDEVAYACGMTALNGEGTIIADGNDFKFLPTKDTNVAPIGNKRVAFINRCNPSGVMMPFVEKKQELISADQKDALVRSLVSAGDVFFIPQTKAGDERAVGIVIDTVDQATGKKVKMSKVIGSTIKVGNKYVNDMFVAFREIGGVQVPANNKKHVIDQCLPTNDGILLVLAC